MKKLRILFEYENGHVGETIENITEYGSYREMFERAMVIYEDKQNSADIAVWIKELHLE